MDVVLTVQAKLTEVGGLSWEPGVPDPTISSSWQASCLLVPDLVSMLARICMTVMWEKQEDWLLLETW